MTTARQEAEQELAYTVGKERAAALVAAAITEAQQAPAATCGRAATTGEPCPDHPAETDTFIVLAEVAHERGQQDAKWGEQNHNNGTGDRRWQDAANVVRGEVDDAARAGRTTWNGVLREELFEALAESDPARLRAELVQVAAVAVCWIEAIDRRTQAAGGEQQ